jgi:hypothetical protein
VLNRKVGESIDRVGISATHHINVANSESRFRRNSNARHRKSIGGTLSRTLLPRHRRWNKNDLAEVERVKRFGGDNQMTNVDGVKGSTHYANSAPGRHSRHKNLVVAAVVRLRRLVAVTVENVTEAEHHETKRNEHNKRDNREYPVGKDQRVQNFFSGEYGVEHLFLQKCWCF